jgi:glutathione reductase (NADPH)
MDACTPVTLTDVEVYHTKFSAMFYDIFPAEERAKNPTEYKIVCAGPDEKVVGLHILGDSSGEVSWHLLR